MITTVVGIIIVWKGRPGMCACLAFTSGSNVAEGLAAGALLGPVALGRRLPTGHIHTLCTYADRTALLAVEMYTGWLPAS